MLEVSRKVQRAGLHPGPAANPTTAADGLAFETAWNSVGADYFSTVGLPVVRGRAFTEAEATQPGPKVAIIDEVLARNSGRMRTRLDNAFNMRRQMPRQPRAAEAPMLEGAPIWMKARSRRRS